MGTYTRELCRALLRRPGGHTIRLAAHVFRHPGWRARAARMFGGAPVAASRLLPHGAALELDRLLGLPWAETLFGGCEVFHGTNFLAPPCRRARAVVTVHDLAFLKLADEAPVAHRYERHVRRVVSRAHRVIAVSRATARDVVDLLGVAPGRVRAVHLGPPTDLPTLAETEWEEARERHGIPSRFLLFVGTLEPRKNLVRLIGAYHRAADRLSDPPGLVLAGRRGWHCRPVLEAIRRTRRPARVVWTGFVPTPLRNSLYRNALAALLPSLYEGFGLPALEAFASGTPLLAADAGALPEVCGDAALLADPRNEAALADSMVELVQDESLRRDLAARGRERERRFSWARAARETIEVYEDA